MLYPYYICAPYGLALEEREAIKHVVVTKSTTRFVLTHPPNSRRQRYYIIMDLCYIWGPGVQRFEVRGHLEVILTKNVISGSNE